MSPLWGRLLGGIAALLLLTLGIWALWAAGSAPGRPVPDYEAQVLGSKRQVKLAEMEGVVLLNMWATWCRPCRREMPALQAIYARYADKGLKVIGVNVNKPTASDRAIAEFVQAIGVTYRIWQDPCHIFVEAFRVIGVPQTFVIVDGRILHQWRGRMNPAAPRNLALIQAALGLAGQAGAAL